MKHRNDNRPWTDLKDLYTEINAELFGSSLPPAEELGIYLRSKAEMKDHLGNIQMAWSRNVGETRHRPIRWSICIKIQDGLSNRQTRKTMAHEMAHLAAAMEDGTLKHNTTFWRIMERIGYGKHHRFPDAGPMEEDVFTAASEKRQAAWHWRKQPRLSAVKVSGRIYTLLRVQQRGTLALIMDEQGKTYWTQAENLENV
jgi:hypothetical protein